MNQYGTLFNLSIFGESHGAAVGITIDGCPAGIPIDTPDFLPDLKRRKTGKNGTSPRLEADLPKIISGVFKGKSTGSPITLLFDNNNTQSKDYEEIKNIPRPGHADFTAYKKYKGFNDFRGGGHFSGRITVGLVAAGVIAKKILQGVEFTSQVVEVGGRKDIDQAVKEAMESGDSIGGLIECQVKNLPIGLGEPFFDKVEAVIAHTIFSIPAIKSLEFGNGIQAAKMKGSENNDPILDDTGKTASNNAGGMNGGITNGNDLLLRVAVKPTSSIKKTQQTYSIKSKGIEKLSVRGRHDACIALRLPVIVEAATAVALADLYLRHKTNVSD
jgi:chorismate synthase